MKVEPPWFKPVTKWWGRRKEGADRPSNDLRLSSPYVLYYYFFCSLQAVTNVSTFNVWFPVFFLPAIEVELKFPLCRKYHTYFFFFVLWSVSILSRVSFAGCMLTSWRGTWHVSAVTHQSFPSIPCCEACIDYSLLYLLSLNFPGKEKEHSLNMESFKRSTLQRESQNLTSQSLVISCTILRLLGVPCTNSAPFSGDVFIHFTDVKPLQGFSSQSFHLSAVLQGEEGGNH